MIPMTALLEIDHLQINRRDEFLLSVDHLDIQTGETLAVIGPNGAGKSTLLLAVAGLIPLGSGEIRFAGQLVVPEHDLAYRRRLGIVMQSPLLLHETVFNNAATGLRFRNLSTDEVNRRVNGWLERLDIAQYRKRLAQQLSGGEAQRVSLARAFVLQPDLLLMDEPFGALDAPTRSHLLDDLHHILKTTGQTAVFITHDLDEALYLGDRVAVMMNGRLRQVGVPGEVFTAPADPEVAHFVGVETVFAGRVTAVEDGLLSVDCGGVQVQAAGEAPVGGGVLLCLRPEDITLFPSDGAHLSSARNRVRGRVERLIPQGALLRVVVSGDIQLVALITRASQRELNLQEGSPVEAAFKATAIHVIRK